MVTFYSPTKADNAGKKQNGEKTERLATTTVMKRQPD